MNEVHGLATAETCPVEVVTTPTRTEYRGVELPPCLPTPVEVTVQQQADGAVTVHCKGDADRAALVLSTALVKMQRPRRSIQFEGLAVLVGAIALGLSALILAWRYSAPVQQQPAMQQQEHFQ